MSWRERAACTGADTELFFPTQGSEPREAKAICAGCPVQDPCLKEGWGEDGVWGGRSARWRLRKELRAS